jgi:hypothetical protein
METLESSIAAQCKIAHDLVLELFDAEGLLRSINRKKISDQTARYISGLAHFGLHDVEQLTELAYDHVKAYL